MERRSSACSDANDAYLSTVLGNLCGAGALPFDGDGFDFHSPGCHLWRADMEVIITMEIIRRQSDVLHQIPSNGGAHTYLM